MGRAMINFYVEAISSMRFSALWVEERAFRPALQHKVDGLQMPWWKSGALMKWVLASTELLVAKTRDTSARPETQVNSCKVLLCL